MGENRDDEPGSGSFTPQDLADPTKHRHTQIFERENRPQGGSPGGEDASESFQQGEDMIAGGEQSVGEAPGPDTSGAVAAPAERNRPGASTKLGGTPGANTMPSGGRDTDY